jgi:DNA-binding CsgD family transcriptional regulator
MSNKERLFLLVVFSFISIMILADLLTDFDEGVTFWHLLIEGSAGIVAIGGVLFVLKSMLLLKADLSKERQNAVALEQEAENWREQAKEYLAGLSAMIDSQLSQWSLTPAEKEVAFLLLKGFSLSDIATFRGTSEKTIRAQCTAIYAKAGLKNRSELAAFFLEDLLPGRADEV